MQPMKMPWWYVSSHFDHIGRSNYFNIDLNSIFAGFCRLLKAFQKPHSVLHHQTSWKHRPYIVCHRQIPSWLCWNGLNVMLCVANLGQIRWPTVKRKMMASQCKWHSTWCVWLQPARTVIAITTVDPRMIWFSTLHIFRKMKRESYLTQSQRARMESVNKVHFCWIVQKFSSKCYFIHRFHFWQVQDCL